MRVNCLIAWVALFCVFSDVSANLAKLRMGGGSILSSDTLEWKRNYRINLDDAIPVEENTTSHFWCRIRISGTYAGGVLSDDACKAPFLSKIYTVTDGYEILTSVRNSARVKRIKWDYYNSPPEFSIVSSEKEEHVLAFQVDNKLNIKAGYFKPSDRRITVAGINRVEHLKNGYVMVEDLPINYTLQDIEFDIKRKSVEFEEIVTTYKVLANLGSGVQHIAETVDIVANHSIYWGQIKGTLVGKWAFVISPKPEVEYHNLTWGIRNEFDRIHSVMLDYKLPPGTATNVTVIGIVRKTESPYTGSLMSTYSDGFEGNRVIRGLHMDQRLLQLKAVYSKPYYMHNNTELDMDIRTSVLYKSTTTTTTTTTTTITPPSTTVHEAVSLAISDESNHDSMNGGNSKDSDMFHSGVNQVVLSIGPLFVSLLLPVLCFWL